MQVNERFLSFFTASYTSQLQDLDKTRKRILFNYFVIGTVMFAGFVFEAVTWMLIGIVFIVLFIFFYIRTFGISTSYFQQQFFKKVQGAVGLYFLPSSTYDSDRYIKLSLLQKAMLLTSSPSLFGGRNMMEHKFDGDWIQLSEIEASTTGKNEKGLQEVTTNFHGFVGVRQVKTSLENPVILMHSDWDNFIRKTKPSNVQDHEELLAWYDDEKTFNQLFSPSRLVEIMGHIEHSGDQIFISVFSEGVCVAVSPKGKHNYLDAGLWNKVHNEEEIKRLFTSYAFITDMLLAIKP